MDAEIFVPFTFFVFLTIVIVGPVMLRERTKRSAYELVSRAVERGEKLDPALIAKLSEGFTQEPDRARKNLGNAVILLSLAGGFVGAAFVVGQLGGEEAHNGMLIPAVILAAVGIAFMLLSIIDYATKKKTPAEA